MNSIGVGIRSLLFLLILIVIVAFIVIFCIKLFCAFVTTIKSKKYANGLKPCRR